jgi:hypothetical protein
LRALRARYPGVQVAIEWIDHDNSYLTDPALPQYKGWLIEFRASKFETLVRYGIATDRDLAACYAHADNFDTTDEFGHWRYVRCEWPRGAMIPRTCDPLCVGVRQCTAGGRALINASSVNDGSRELVESVREIELFARKCLMIKK